MAIISKITWKNNGIEEQLMILMLIADTFG